MGLTWGSKPQHRDHWAHVTGDKEPGKGCAWVIVVSGLVAILSTAGLLEVLT
jgi:hypothetical protein